MIRMAFGLVLAVSAVCSAQVVGWRGDGNGVFTKADPPAKFGPKENVLWKAPVKAGYGSVIVVGDKVLLTGEPMELFCLNKTDGKKVWKKSFAKEDLPKDLQEKEIAGSTQCGFSTPTPVSDGKSVWVVFGNGITACLDLADGKVKWTTLMEYEQNTGDGRSTSPLLVGDKLIYQISGTLALDAATGKKAWYTEEAVACYGTPVATKIGDVDVIVTPKGDVVRVSDGKILAKELGTLMYTSPVVKDGVVYFAERSVTAVPLPAKATDSFKTKELWSETVEGEFFASPVIADGRLYTVDKGGSVYCLDIKTGKKVYENLSPAAKAAAEAGGLGSGGESQGPTFYASLVLAGKNIIAANDGGVVLVLATGPTYKEVARIDMGEGSGGTPTVDGNCLFLRGGDTLYCIGTADAATSKPAAETKPAAEAKPVTEVKPAETK